MSEPALKDELQADEATVAVHSVDEKPKDSVAKKFWEYVPMAIFMLASPLLFVNENSTRATLMTYGGPLLGLFFIYAFLSESGLINKKVQRKIETPFEKVGNGIVNVIAWVILAAFACVAIAAIGAVIYLGISWVTSLSVSTLLLIIIFILLTKK